MKHPVAVIDTNVVVSGLFTADAGSPPARILDGMRQGTFPFLLSDQLLAEYSFAGIDKPIGISTYELTRALPARLRSALPTVEEIEAELAGETRKTPPSKSTVGRSKTGAAKARREEA